MDFLYVLIALAVLGMIGFLLSVRRTWKRRTALPFRLESVLFSDKERALLSVLEQCLVPDFRVMGKVRVSDVLALKKRVDRQTRERALERIGDRKLDFLICTSDALSIAGAVELVGSGLHQRKGDKTLAKVCDTVGLPLVHIQEAESYDAGAIEDQVRTAINAPRIMVQPEPTDARDEELVLSSLSASIRDNDSEPELRS